MGIKPGTSTTPITRLQCSILDEDEKIALLWISSKQGSKARPHSTWEFNSGILQAVDESRV